jgi:hypothetical protein
MICYRIVLGAKSFFEVLEKNYYLRLKKDMSKKANGRWIQQFIIDKMSGDRVVFSPSAEQKENSTLSASKEGSNTFKNYIRMQ